MSTAEYEDLLSRGPRFFGVEAIPLLALVGANLIPLFAVLFFGWDLSGVMLVYWAENVVVGLWAIVRMLFVGRLAALPMVIFFCVHYGMFTFVHLVFVYALTEATDWNAVEWEGSGFSAPSRPGAPLLPGETFFSQLSWWALAALVLSHGISFVRNFLRGGEWKKSTIGFEMGRPYPRMAVMHVAIIAGAFAIALAGQPVALLAVLVLLKTAVDAIAHIIEHRLLDKRSRSITAPASAKSTTGPRRSRRRGRAE